MFDGARGYWKVSRSFWALLYQPFASYHLWTMKVVLLWAHTWMLILQNLVCSLLPTTCWGQCKDPSSFSIFLGWACSKERFFMSSLRGTLHWERGRLSNDCWIDLPISSTLSQLTSSFPCWETTPVDIEWRCWDSTRKGFIPANQAKNFWQCSKSIFFRDVLNSTRSSFAVVLDATSSVKALSTFAQP